MCVEYCVIASNGEKVYCKTVGELAAALGFERQEVSNDPEDCCLCNAKREALGARRATEAEG